MPEAAIILASTALFGWGLAGWVSSWRWRRAYAEALATFEGLIRERDA